MPQERSLHSRHDAPIQPTALRRRGITHNDRDDAGVRAGLVEGLPGFGQLDLLEAIRDEDGDLQSFEIIIRAMFLPLYAAFLKLPWGSMTNFLAAPLSKSL